MTANVTFDIGVITNVDDKSSSFTAMAALSFYWRDNALSEWNVKEAITAHGNNTPQYYAQCFGDFFAAGSTGTQCVLQVSVPWNPITLLDMGPTVTPLSSVRQARPLQSLVASTVKVMAMARS